MIFKIKINIKDIQKYIKLFSKDYNIMFLNCLYISSKSYNDNKNIDTLIEYYKLYKNISIYEINEKNLRYENEKIIGWCREEFVRCDLEKFEIQEQEQLKESLRKLDELEKELNKISKTNGGEETCQMKKTKN